MEEESDKTTALKKAFAEIILNTAKESAARVMVSDRKSALFQLNLCGTKEEALRLLVRLKQMIDAKTIEAEITSSNQQRQIDVLEAQLQEAEDIITDMRSELRWVRDKLEKVRVNVVNKEEETISAQNVDSEVVVGSLHPNQEIADSFVSVASESFLNQSLLHDDECGNDGKRFDGLSVNTLKGCDACESEFEVDIRNQKLELSRNGCTHRIHALEIKSSPSANEEERRTTVKDSEENLSSGKVNRHETGTWGTTRSLVLALRSSNAEVITMPSNALGIKKTSKLRGKRKGKWGKRKATPVRSQSQLIKPCQSKSDLPCSKTSMENSDGEDSMEMHLSVESEEMDVLNACKRLEEHLQHKRTLYAGDIGIIRKGKRSKNMENLGGVSSSSTVNPADHLVEARQASNLVSINAKDGENKVYILEIETKMNPLPCLDPELTSIKSNVDPTSGSTDATVISANTTNRSTGEEDSAVVSDQISESPRTDRNRLVKYTFQRKRKRYI